MSDVSMPDGPTTVYLDRYTTDDSDSLSYDNESVRYDYDLMKSGEHEDVSGQGGAGYTTEDTDVYVSGHFDEATGNVGGRIDRLYHRFIIYCLAIYGSIGNHIWCSYFLC